MCVTVDPSVTDLNTRTFTCYEVGDSTCTIEDSFAPSDNVLDQTNNCCSGSPDTYFTIGSDLECLACKLLFVPA